MAMKSTIPQSMVDKGAASLNDGEWLYVDAVTGQQIPCRRDEIAHAVLTGALEYVALVDHVAGSLSNDDGDRPGPTTHSEG